MRLIHCLALCASVFVAPTANAATQILSGAANNSLFDVVYDDALVGLFGVPSLNNNVISFTPTSFVANATQAGQNVTTNSTINLQLVALPGYDFAQFNLVERGDFFLDGANTRVRALGQIRAFDTSAPLVDFTDPIVSRTASGPSVGTLLSALPAGSAYHTGLIYNWQGTASINAVSTGLFDADRINLTIENILRASNGAAVNGFAPESFIEKKFNGVAMTVTLIPEPSETMLMLSAIGIIGAIARRRRSL
jgi:hypothetical protein